MTLCPNSPYRIHTISKHPILNDDIYQGPWLWNTADCKYRNSFHTQLYLSLYTTFHGLIHTCRYILPRWVDCGRRRGVGERGIPEHTAAGLSDGFVQAITQPRLRRRLLMEREDFGSLCPCPCPSHPIPGERLLNRQGSPPSSHRIVRCTVCR